MRTLCLDLRESHLFGAAGLEVAHGHENVGVNTALAKLPPNHDIFVVAPSSLNGSWNNENRDVDGDDDRGEKSLHALR
jgi:hypothetical protein